MPAVAAPSVNWNQTDYWFRDDDGAELTATGFGSPNLGTNTDISSLPTDAQFRLRFGVKAQGNDGTITPQIEYKQGTRCTTGAWTPITATSPIFILHPSANFTDGDLTTQQITTKNFTPGYILSSVNPGPTITISKTFFTEYEWSLQALDTAPTGTTFSFRISDAGAALDTYNKCPSLLTESAGLPPTPPPASQENLPGGSLRPSTVNFSGKAYPGAQIFLVEKVYEENVLLKQGVPVSDNGEFKLGGIPTGFHSYSLLIKDAEGRQTQTKVYNNNFINDSMSVENIVISPTIDVTRSIVTQGDFFKVVGSAFPRSKVRIQLDNAQTFETEADDTGDYALLVPTASLLFGQHTIRANQIDATSGKESDWSLTRNITVSASTVINADLNADGAINISDWSIFLARWKSEAPEDRKMLDLNSDGRVNLTDLGIFLRSLKIISPL